MVSNGTTWIPAAGSVNPPVESLYVHVPFCAQKCEYCAFYSGPASGDLIQRYVQALLLELELIAQDCRPKTVFFGGGTPSLLTLKPSSVGPGQRCGVQRGVQSGDRFGG